MIPLSHYWQWVRLKANGQTRIEEIPAAKDFLQQQFPHFQQATVESAALSRQLIQQVRDATVQPDHRTLAELCLRCRISHQIEQVCIQLETQFGSYYGFTRQDLLPFVLDDAGDDRGYESLAMQILQSFDPERASLLTWTTRLVKQHREINAFLLQRGLCMLSDWALLNETTQKKLRRVLGQFYQLTETEIAAAALLLESYHAVYRQERLLQGQKGYCPTPTEAQLAAIAHQIQQTTGQLSKPAVILNRLQALADRLRQYRIATRGGTPASKPLGDADEQPSAQTDDDTLPQEFLHHYRQQFLTSLEMALAQVISDRVQALKPAKQQLFLSALQMFHCKGLAMVEIAAQLGLNSYFQVSRLLKLTELRADVRHSMLHQLRSTVTQLASHYATPERLHNLDSQVEIVLAEQVDRLLQDEAARSKTPKTYQAMTLFARTLCHYLHRRSAF